MHMFELMRREDFDAARKTKLINERDDGAGLFIYNYSDAAMYTDGAWDNPAVRQCRGLIADRRGEVAARPWSKFFNHGQVEAGDLDLSAPVEVTDKLDGSLGVIYRALNGTAKVSSRGSFESDQAIHATARLAEMNVSLLLETVTPLVEIIYPANRIVVDYGTLDDLVLLGGVVIATGKYLGPAETADAVGWRHSLASVFPYASLREALAAPDRKGMEGLCVRYLDRDHIVKIKQEDYVRLHRIVTGLSERTVWQHMIDGQSLETLLSPLPDELHGWTREVWSRIADEAYDIHSAALVAHDVITQALPTGWTRGDYAAHAKTHRELTPLLFQILDGKAVRPAILRNLKPAGDTRARAISEAVA